MPPQPPTFPTIADALTAKGVSWKYYSGGRGDGTSTPSGTTADYCGICDPLTGFTSIMTTPLKANLQDLNNLYNDIAAGKVPAVAYVCPLEQMAGHPANATIALYENFVTNLVNMVHDQPDLWSTTAILITVDEGGGYYDTGYIQPVDFFGDGTRIPLIAVSPYAKKGFVDHTYYDHASVLKFIERNWGPSSPSRRAVGTTCRTRRSRGATCRLTARRSAILGTVKFRKIPAQRARDQADCRRPGPRPGLTPGPQTGRLTRKVTGRVA